MKKNIDNRLIVENLQRRWTIPFIRLYFLPYIDLQMPQQKKKGKKKNYLQPKHYVQVYYPGHLSLSSSNRVVDNVVCSKGGGGKI